MVFGLYRMLTFFVQTGGNPSLVFDCVYNSTLKSRSLRDSDFKIFLVGKLNPALVFCPSFYDFNAEANPDQDGIPPERLAEPGNDSRCQALSSGAFKANLNIKLSWPILGASEVRELSTEPRPGHWMDWIASRPPLALTLPTLTGLALSSIRVMRFPQSYLGLF